MLLVLACFLFFYSMINMCYILRICISDLSESHRLIVGSTGGTHCLGSVSRPYFALLQRGLPQLMQTRAQPIARAVVLVLLPYEPLTLTLT